MHTDALLIVSAGQNQTVDETCQCWNRVALQSMHQSSQVCRAAGVPLVINDRIDIALALGPDVGVHVGQVSHAFPIMGGHVSWVASGAGQPQWDSHPSTLCAWPG